MPVITHSRNRRQNKARWAAQCLMRSFLSGPKRKLPFPQKPGAGVTMWHHMKQNLGTGPEQHA